jgi:hypothetical protein
MSELLQPIVIPTFLGVNHAPSHHLIYNYIMMISKQGKALFSQTFAKRFSSYDCAFADQKFYSYFGSLVFDL